jgi:hypothetical protein
VYLADRIAAIMLKAFLLAHGWSDQQIKDAVFRNNISNLMAEAIRHGLNISPTARSEIDRLNEAHEEFWPRYPRQAGSPVFIINQFERPVVELLKSGRGRNSWRQSFVGQILRLRCGGPPFSVFKAVAALKSFLIASPTTWKS